MEEELAQLKQIVAAQQRRLDYAVLQLSREAKFLPESRPENRRFYRAFEVVVEVNETLRGI